jgi:valyl-tRNA synthetase
MGDVPFREVYIHGLVRDAERQKMSKTKGNVVDPLELTEKFGTDAVRMGLLHGAAPGTDIVLTPERMESARNFANKLWNAARFMFLNMERSAVEAWVPEPGRPRLAEVEPDSLEASLEDRWIFSRLNRTADLAGRAIERYRYHEAAQVLWQFVWREFCDWYLEIKKLRFRDNSGLDAGWRNILTVFEAMLRLLHPVMPFITEELWQRITANAAERPKSIALAPYPEYKQASTDLNAEREMELLQDIIVSARNLRADMGVNNPKLQLAGTLYSPGPAAQIAQRQLEVIQKLTGVNLDIVESAAPSGVQGVKRATTEYDLVLQIPTEQSDVQRKRLEKEIDQLEKVIANSERQLGDEKFLARAPEAVVNSIKGKLAEYKGQLEKSREALGALQ